MSKASHDSGPSSISLDLFRRYQQAEDKIKEATEEVFSLQTKLGIAKKNLETRRTELESVKGEFPAGTFNGASTDDLSDKERAILDTARKIVDDKNEFKKVTLRDNLSDSMFGKDHKDQNVQNTLKKLVDGGKLERIDGKQGWYKLTT